MTTLPSDDPVVAEILAAFRVAAGSLRLAPGAGRHQVRRTAEATARAMVPHLREAGWTVPGTTSRALDTLTLQRRYERAGVDYSTTVDGPTLCTYARVLRARECCPSCGQLRPDHHQEVH